MLTMLLRWPPLQYIPALVEEFHGRKWPKFNSEKICQIAYGRIQASGAGLSGHAWTSRPFCRNSAPCALLELNLQHCHLLPLQGKAALVQHFQNSSLLHEDKRCRPIWWVWRHELKA